MLAVEGSGWERASSRNFNIEYLESPELNITRLVVPVNPMLEGTNVTIEVTVHNEGNGVVSGASLTLYEITFGLSNKLIREMIMDLDPGEKITLSVNWTADVAAKSIRATVGCPGGVSEMDLSNNDLTRPVYVNPVEKNISDEGKHSGFLGSVPGEVAFVAVAGSLAIAGALTVVISSDVFRYGFFSLAIPLYSKLKPEHLLSNRLRRRIYVYVQNHPGEHFRSILLNLNLTNGTLAHHLYTLERESLIRSRRDGLYRRFYPAGYKIDENNLNISPIQRSILDLIDERPGLSQKDISRELDVSSSTVNYNIKSLKSRHMLKVVRDGKMTRVFREKDRNC
jgi:DNA-binding MarR family transcriptional regulator